MSKEQGHRLALPAGYTLHWYKIESILGQGGFGITYLARDTNLDQLVAIKEFLPTDLAVRTHDSSVHPLSEGHQNTYGWGLSRFVTEAKTLAKFRHPNVVLVHSVFEANETAYMVMEYVRGRTLEDALKFGKVQSEAELKRIMLALLDGLTLIHQAGFIHRDIKPDNIYLRDDGTPVLLDFGSARQAVGEKTRTLTALVSPGYAPYEQYDSSRGGESKQGPWTDIYGLGATLYRAVTGKGPVDATARVNAILDGDDILVPARKIGEGKFSPEFLNAIDWALALRPRDRPQDVDTWRQALTGELHVDASTRVPDAETIKAATRSVSPSTRPGDTRPSARKRAEAESKSRSGALAVAALLLIALAGGGWWAWTGTDWFKSAEPPTAAAPVPPPATEVTRSAPPETSAPEPVAETRAATEQESTAAPAAERAEREAQARRERERAAEVEAEARRQARIEELLNLADADLAAGRLTSPPGENALERYESALKADPDNARAAKGKQQIFTRFLEQGTALIEEKKFDEAERALMRADAVEPDSSAVRLARVRLEDAKREAERIARLEQEKKEEEARKAREAEQRRLAELERKRQEEAEAKRQEELARQRAEEERRRAEEERRKAEEARLAELERQRQEELARKRAEEEKQNKYNQFIAVAEQAINAKDRDLAVANFNQALALYPGDQAAYSGLQRAQRLKPRFCYEVLGKWVWSGFGGGEMTLNEDGTMQIPIFSGSWTCADPAARKISMSGAGQTMTGVLSEDGSCLKIDHAFGSGCYKRPAGYQPALPPRTTTAAAPAPQPAAAQPASRQSAPMGGSMVKFAIFPFETDRPCTYPVGEEIRNAVIESIKRNSNSALEFSYYDQNAQLGRIPRPEDLWSGGFSRKEPVKTSVLSAASRLGVNGVMMAWYECLGSSGHGERDWSDYIAEGYLFDVDRQQAYHFRKSILDAGRATSDLFQQFFSSR
ncbi:MAG: protein kinase [Gammaproteobacteria bacterium]|nr:protein kinase [Gammaproteobacteria bacterium]